MIIEFEGQQHEFPDDFTDQDIAAALGGASKPQVGVGEDLLKTAPAAVGRLGSSLIGAPGDTRQLAGMAADYLGVPQGVQNFARNAARGIPGVGPMLASGPTSEQVQGKLEGVTGKLYNPKTFEGKVLDTGIQLLPNLAGGPGSLGLKAATQVAAPALVSEAVGDVTDQNPIAKTVAAIGTSLIGGRPPKVKSTAITPDEAKAFTDQKYKEVHNLGLELRPSPLVNLGNQLETKLNAEGATARNAGPVHAAIKAELIDLPLTGKPVTTQKFDALRKELVAGTQSADGTIRHAAGIAIRELDNYLAHLPKSHVIKGDAAAAAKLFGEARAQHAATKRLEMASGKVELGQLNAQTANSGMNLDNNLRQALKQLIRPGKFGKTEAQKQGFNAAEIAQMKKIAKRTNLGNIIRWLGDAAGGGGGAPALAAGAVGVYGAGGPEGLALPATGFLLRKTGGRMTQRQADKLLQMVGDRSPLGQLTPRPKPRGVLSDLDEKMLRAAIASRAFYERDE